MHSDARMRIIIQMKYGPALSRRARAPASSLCGVLKVLYRGFIDRPYFCMQLNAAGSSLKFTEHEIYLVRVSATRTYILVYNGRALWIS